LRPHGAREKVALAHPTGAETAPAEGSRMK
jgi:hypothetical protein